MKRDRTTLRIGENGKRVEQKKKKKNPKIISNNFVQQVSYKKPHLAFEKLRKKKEKIHLSVSH